MDKMFRTNHSTGSGPIYVLRPCKIDMEIELAVIASSAPDGTASWNFIGVGRKRLYIDPATKLARSAALCAARNTTMRGAC